MTNSLFFIHIPKTAGTSLRSELYKNFNSDDIFPSIVEINSNQGNYPDPYYLQNHIHIMMDKKLIYGHYPFPFSKDIHQKFDYLTFLREPIKRTVSHLKHYQKHIPDYQNLSIEYVFDERSQELKNLQTKYLRNRKEGSPNSIDLEDAKRNLDNFFFVGLVERYHESINQLNAKLNLQLNSEVKENVIGDTVGILKDLNPEFVKKIEEINNYDLQLYEFATNKLDQAKDNT